MDLYGQTDNPSMEICALAQPAASPIDLLMAVKPFAPSKDQDFIDVMINFIQGFQIRKNYQEMQGTSADSTGADFPFEQLKGFLSPKQQSRLEKDVYKRQHVYKKKQRIRHKMTAKH